MIEEGAASVVLPLSIGVLLWGVEQTPMCMYIYGCICKGVCIYMYE